MENDDRQQGRILNRRDVLRILGITSASILAGCVPGLSGALQATSTPAQATSATNTVALPACIVRPEVTEGPYYVDEELNRSDIRSDPATGAIKDGVLLTLTFNVSQVGNGGCTPLEGAKVDIWHCDAAGVYSDVSDPGFNTRGQKFLRGYQVTDANGQATFVTIYPGWYSGRTVHIHFKIQYGGTDQSRVFTSQLFFDDSLSDKVFAQPPYSSKGQRNTLNGTDGIYNDQLLLNVNQGDNGYAAAFDIGLQTA
jgi:protocatechuate 3,4-dioxygenase beta subunit